MVIIFDDVERTPRLIVVMVLSNLLYHSRFNGFLQFAKQIRKNN